jgi:hypothetical protein
VKAVKVVVCLLYEKLCQNYLNFEFHSTNWLSNGMFEFNANIAHIWLSCLMYTNTQISSKKLHNCKVPKMGLTITCFLYLLGLNFNNNPLIFRTIHVLTIL